MAMIFQDPLSVLHRYFTVGHEISEAYLIHNKVGKKAARQHAIDMLGRVGMPQPASRVDGNPHQFSGRYPAAAKWNRPGRAPGDEASGPPNADRDGAELELCRQALAAGLHCLHLPCPAGNQREGWRHAAPAPA